MGWEKKYLYIHIYEIDSHISTVGRPATTFLFILLLYIIADTNIIDTINTVVFSYGVNTNTYILYTRVHSCEFEDLGPRPTVLRT